MFLLYLNGCRGCKMARIYLLIALALLVTGCGVARKQSSCSDQHTSYIDMWDCIKRSNIVPNDASGVRYKASGDALAEAVAAGKMTDLQAKAALAGELDNAEQNHRRRAGSGPTTCNAIGNTLMCY
jgi:hypothetical protein